MFFTAAKSSRQAFGKVFGGEAFGERDQDVTSAKRVAEPAAKAKTARQRRAEKPTGKETPAKNKPASSETGS